MKRMFCYQCEQTAGGTGCTITGICGKKPNVARRQDELTCELIALAVAAGQKGGTDSETVDLIIDGLFITLTNVNFDNEFIEAFTETVKKHRVTWGGKRVLPREELFHNSTNLISMRSTLLFGLRGMAAYAYHARILGRREPEVDSWFIKGMAALIIDHDADNWLTLLQEFGEINLKCMAMLDTAHTENYGDPVPTTIPLTIEKGPFIVISGHDLHDLQMLLEQTEGKGINVYTHGEMLPAHGYPNLKKYRHLKGNFGTAWQNQQKEFTAIPGPVLFTTNCLMPPKASYSDRVYTTSVVGHPKLKYIGEDQNGHKDFSPLIEHAMKLGGYQEKQQFTGINEGTSVTTGYARQTMLDSIPAIVSAIKAGEIKHIFLIGGCDGAAPGRNYYTKFARQTPPDSVILTLACGKYRLNDLDLGMIGPFPRILDMGQCNDAYGAIRVALALANSLDCNINELPLTFVLSWYEQKAVCILLTMMALGIRDIYLGPSLPAFFSKDVTDMLVEKYELHPISTPEQDLARILGQ